MAQVHIATSAQAKALYARGYNIYTRGNGLYYDPAQRAVPGKAMGNLQWISSPAEAQALAKGGVHIITSEGGQYYQGSPMQHITDPAESTALASEGTKVYTYGGGQYYSGAPQGTAFPTVTPPPFTSAEQSAWAQLAQTLGTYGFNGNDLTALTNWAKGELIAGKDTNQVALDLQTTPQFKARFPAILARQQAGLPPVSPAEYLSNETSYEQLERAAGIPPNFASYDALIAADVSPTEYSDRLNQGFLAVSQADPEVVKAFQDYYGVSRGQLAAYFLDPKKMEPQLLQQAAAAQVGGASAQSGFGEISTADATRLAQMGINFSQAQQGFQKLATESQLYRGLPGQNEPSLSEAQLVNAQFGSDAQTQQALSRQAGYETGTTNQGSQVSGTSTGATGLGTLQR